MKYLLYTICILLFFSCSKLNKFNLKNVFIINTSAKVYSSNRDSVDISVSTEIFKNKYSKKYLKPQYKVEIEFIYKPIEYDPTFTPVRNLK